MGSISQVLRESRGRGKEDHEGVKGDASHCGLVPGILRSIFKRTRSGVDRDESGTMKEMAE